MQHAATPFRPSARSPLAAILLGLGLLCTLPAGAASDPAASPAGTGSAQPSGENVLPQLGGLNLQTPDGKPFDVNGLRGKPAIVNFWGTWCAPCMREMPDLATLNKEFGEAVNFVGVAADSPKNVSRFQEKNPDIAFPLLPVGYKVLPLTRAWGNEEGGLPFTVVLDAQGRIHWRHAGQVSIESLRSVLKSAELQ